MPRPDDRPAEPDEQFDSPNPALNQAGMRADGVISPPKACLGVDRPVMLGAVAADASCAMHLILDWRFEDDLGADRRRLRAAVVAVT